MESFHDESSQDVYGGPVAGIFTGPHPGGLFSRQDTAAPQTCPIAAILQLLSSPRHIGAAWGQTKNRTATGGRHQQLCSGWDRFCGGSPGGLRWEGTPGAGDV
jgi:hypothetical protein